MRPRLLELNLGDGGVGDRAQCGGTIEVFVEPLAASTWSRAYPHRKGRAGGDRDPPRPAGGAKILVLDDGEVVGTLGDKALTRASPARPGGDRRRLVRTLSRASSRVPRPPALLLIVGANHVAMPLTRWRRCSVSHRVLDGRPRFATKERFSDVDG